MGDDLLDALRVHRANLDKLEVQRAQHGVQVPLDILNGIEAELAAIQRIEQALEDRQYQKATLPTIAETSGMAETIPSYASDIAMRINDLTKEVHRLATQVAVNETRMIQMQNDMASLRAEVTGIRNASEPVFSRAVLIGGGTLAIGIFVLLIIVSIRLVSL